MQKIQKNIFEFEFSQPASIPRTTVLGEGVDRSARGNFYFLTNSVSPYSKRSAKESTNCTRVEEYQTRQEEEKEESSAK